MMIVNDIMLERRDLIRSFNELKSHRIILVSAPAGYGKTVAVMQWLSKDSRVKAVFHLDEYDNNTASFCERFSTTLLACQPRNQTLSELVSHPSFQSAPDEFTLKSLSALSSRKQTVLVIDDLHLIRDKEVLQLLLTSIKRLPKNFQVILISRHDLPQGFSELWLKNQINRVSMKQFLFSIDEIKSLCNMRGNQLTQEQVEDISHQTSGWAIGINAFLLSGKDSFDVAYDYLGDFLKANIWDKWDDVTRGFMLRTATLRELTPSLCSAMTGVVHSDKLLKELVRTGAFITQSQSGIYRYHHLFQRFLINMIQEQGDEFLSSLLNTEGNWHLSQRDFYNAIDCFIQCKNHESIAKCFDLLEATGHKDFVLKRLLSIIEEPEIKNAAKKYPHMLFPMAWCAFAEGRAVDMFSFMDEYYARHSEVVKRYQDVAYKTLYMRVLDFRTSLTEILDEFDVQPTKPNLIVIRWTISIRVPLPHRGLRDFSRIAIGDVVENFMPIGVRAGWIFGDEQSMMTSSIIAGLLYEQGNLEKSYKYAIESVAKIKSDFWAESNFCSMSVLICVLDALGDSSEAEIFMHSMSEMIEEVKAFHLNCYLNAFSNRRKFAAGDIKAAEDWTKTQIVNNPTLLGMYVAITTCRAFIATEKYNSALVLLRKVLEIANAFDRTQDIIEARILQAIACWKKKRGFQKEALKHLEEAILTAYPYGFVQMFINEGTELSNMLYKLQKSVEQRKGEDKKHLSFIGKLYLKTYEISNKRLIAGLDRQSIKFTDKQRTVMSLLCQGKKRREIAEDMGIKQSTLRCHLESIYSKLKVSNVENAIIEINTLGLLE